MNGTVVITRQTRGTLPSMQPFGRCTFNIVYRAHLQALAASDTDVGIHRELLVCDHPLVEVTADDV